MDDGSRSAAEPRSSQDTTRTATTTMLSDHVPQSPPRSSSSEALPTHPFDLNFPTLNDDGSVPDLTAHQYRRHHSPTPPAALSSLGARLKMDRREYHSESEGSFTDNQYDMLDDLSEMSDGHDTASIASNGDDGQRTPDDSQSEADPEDSTLLVDDESHATPPSTFQSFIDIDAKGEASSRSDQAAETKAENELIDSYWPDDLETPRQSTIATTLLPRVSYSASSASSDKTFRRILFISEHDDAEQHIMDGICSKLTSCLDNRSSTYKVVRLPATPSGISLPSATVVHDQSSASATIQHCIGADIRTVTSYKLRILDNDGEHSSYFTVGEDAKIELEKPDVAVFYIGPNQDYPDWLDAAQKAVHALKVPALFVFDTNDVMARAEWAQRHLIHHKGTPVGMYSLFELSDMHAGDIVADEILKLVVEKEEPLPSIPHQPIRAIERRPLSSSKLSLWTLFVTLLATLPPLLTLFLTPVANPAAELATRREGLISALTSATNSSAAVKLFNVEHLLPETTGPCKAGSECDSGFRYQGVYPNHLIVSLPSRSRQLQSASVYKANGRKLAFNKTTLIEGVYDIAFDIEQAHGEVFVNVQTRKPKQNLTASHDFGNRMLQRRTYQKAGNDVGKEVSKEVAYVRQKAKSLSEKLPGTIGAGMWATKNVTSQIAVYMARDLQVLGNTAVSIISKAAQVSNETATSLSKDFVLMQNDLVKFTNEVSTKVKSRVELAKEYSRALIRKPIEVSRERFLSFKKASGYGGDANKKDGKCTRKCKNAQKSLAAEPKTTIDDEGRKIAKDLRKEAKKHQKILKKMRAERERAAPPV